MDGGWWIVKGFSIYNLPDIMTSPQAVFMVRDSFLGKQFLKQISSGPMEVQNIHYGERRRCISIKDGAKF